uniref:Nodulin19-like protein 3 n=1 Tax=Trema levigatum TaxID=1184763 RepID=A0A221I0Y1_9ROSA|nr:nodulin19-like protein 3 [Trema levigatum]
MVHRFGSWSLCIAILVLVLSSIPCSNSVRIKNIFKTNSAVFLSPEFKMGPGSVINKYYYNIDFPRGHIAVKSFNAEVVDEAGHPVPLYETYLHHWVIYRYYQPKGNPQKLNESNFELLGNSGVCQDNILGQYYGVGSETRKTPTFVPDPYGIEVGNPAEIPDGHEERWMVNVHAIDTRGTEDGLGCTECRRDLYNVSKDEHGRPLRPDYKGGLLCCYDETQCRLRKGFQGAKRSLYLRFTLEWLYWSDFILPVKIYMFDVTDTWDPLNPAAHDCKIEYDVAKSCEAGHRCIDSKRTRVTMPTGGYLVYGVAHQHTAGAGSALYGEDGRVICASIPIYGKGNEAGNEAGYVVGMSPCYPQPGSVKILDGETLTHESNYSSSQEHIGVMGHFYILVADQLPNPLKLSMHSPL